MMYIIIIIDYRPAHTPFHRQGMPATYSTLIKEGNMLRQTTCHHRHTTAKTSFMTTLLQGAFFVLDNDIQ